MIPRVLVLVIVAALTATELGAVQVVQSTSAVAVGGLRPAAPDAPTGLSLPVVQAVGDSVPAYPASKIAPGAEGAGATALIACRQLQMVVHKVQNLQTGSGTAGSVENALEATRSDRFDIIVGDTAGTVGPARFNEINNKKCVYFAGQTFKGGLQLLGGTGKGPVIIGVSHPIGGADDIVFRYMHARCIILDNETNHCVGFQGQVRNPVNDSTTDNILDHMSVTGGNDEMLSFTDLSKLSGPGEAWGVRGTISYNLFHGVALHHPSAGIVGYGRFPDCGGSGTSVFMNYYSTTHHRQPQNVGSAPACAEHLNNLIYNASPRNTVSSDSTHTDWVANYIEQIATATGNRDQSAVLRVKLGTPDGPSDCIPPAADTLGADTGEGASGVGTPDTDCIKYFVEKNIWADNGVVVIDTTQDQWFTMCDGGIAQQSNSQNCGHDDSPPLSRSSQSSYPGIGVDSTYYRSYERTFGTAVFPYSRISAAQVPDSLIGAGPFATADVNVGANAWLSCDGATWTRYTSAPDSVAITDFHNDVDRSYSNDYLDYMGGSIPVFTAAGPRCADADGDALPDAYELLCTGFSTTAMVFDADESGDGYANMEEYINGTATSGRDVTWQDNSSDEDGFIIERDKGAGFVRLDSLPPNTTFYFDVDAEVGDDYRAIAFNAFGESVPSNLDQAKCR